MEKSESLLDFFWDNFSREIWNIKYSILLIFGKFVVWIGKPAESLKEDKSIFLSKMVLKFSKLFFFRKKILQKRLFFRREKSSSRALGMKIFFKKMPRAPAFSVFFYKKKAPSWKPRLTLFYFILFSYKNAYAFCQIR